jgi:hypothetical protein
VAWKNAIRIARGERAMFPDVPDNLEDDEEHSPTLKIDADKFAAVVVSRLSHLTDTPEEMEFHPVPRHDRSLDAAHTQRVILKFGTSKPPVAVGLDIAGDVVLGRGGGDDASSDVDVDLTHLDAFKRGVSRRHAMLRPTHSKLFLIDLDSTNGTFANMIPVGRGVAREVRHGDIIALGGLDFAIEFVAQPSPSDALDQKPAPEEPPEDDRGVEGLPVTPDILPPANLPSTRPIRELKMRRMAASNDDDQDQDESESETGGR